MKVREIDAGERMALEYFQSQGYNKILHEPDGNVPPDLVIDGEIAVEVRRLNQFKNVKGELQPLEKLEFKIVPKILKIINDYKSVSSDKSAFVSIGFSRPLSVNKNLISEIKRTFDHHVNCLDEHVAYAVHENLRLRFHKAKKNFGYPFVLGSISDNDSGGFVVSNILESLKVVIREKEKKIEPFKELYRVWWLTLVDRIGYGIDEIDLQQLTTALQIESIFEKIVFISPFDSTEGVEINMRNRE